MAGDDGIASSGGSADEGGAGGSPPDGGSPSFDGFHPAPGADARGARGARSPLLERFEEERAIQHARHEVWLRETFEKAMAVEPEAPPPRDPRIWDGVYRLRAILARPGDGQLGDLMASTFMLSMRKRGRPAYDDRVDGLRVYQACTDPTLDGFIDERYEPMTGEALFRRLVEDAKADGVMIDSAARLRDGDVPLKGLLLSPGFAAAALEGRDIRPGAAPLPARSAAEIGMWLDLAWFPTAGRTMVEAPAAGARLVRAHADDHYLPWQAQEADGPQGRTSDVWSPVFSLPPEDEGTSEGGFGEGASRILCPGLLARKFGAVAPGDRRYGTSLGIGRLIGAAERSAARERLALAAEILRLIPPGLTQVPRRSFLSVRGAAFARTHPGHLERDRLQAEAEIAARHLGRWAWGA